MAYVKAALQIFNSEWSHARWQHTPSWGMERQAVVPPIWIHSLEWYPILLWIGSGTFDLDGMLE